MKIVEYPKNTSYDKLLKRPLLKRPDLDALVSKVFKKVEKDGDLALLHFTEKFDGVKLKSLQVSSEEMEIAGQLLSMELKAAISVAKSNIEKFHKAQRTEPEVIETTEGVFCWREDRAIERVGIYIPGGSAPLFSTVLMLGVPAIIAGCDEILLCTPPDKNGNVDPSILFTANLLGIKSVYKVGGIQAIAAFSLGTETIKKVDKIFGPGNQFVTAAKQKALNFGVAIDMPAGPSELLVIADATCNPEFVAADLLSQAEHGADSQVVLLSNDEKVIKETIANIKNQLSKIPRKSIAKKALKNSKAILLNDLSECMLLSNMYAPEHLIIATKEPYKMLPGIKNAGSVFLGNYSCESAGDYASGTNHTLPTNGFSKNYSGVSLDSFVKKITFQEISAQGIKNIGPSIEIMAEAEQLEAHKNAVSLRLKSLQDV